MEELETQVQGTEPEDDLNLLEVDEAETQEKAKMDYTKRANALYERAKSLKLPKETLLDLTDHLSLGRADRVEAKLKAIESKKKNIEDSIVDRRVSERMQEIGIKNDNRETISKANKAEILKRYIEGDPSVSEADYLRVR